MEYVVTMKIKVDKDYFYWTEDVAERQSTLSEQLRNALYDLDDLSITQVLAEEID